MAAFTVRVEIHNASSPLYERLHNAMQSQGFQRSVIGMDGKRYKLPEAEYYFEGLATPEIVRVRAITAAESIGTPYSILVSPLGGPLYWQNLPALPQ